MTNEDPIMGEEQVADAVARYFEENPELVTELAPAHDLWPAIESRISAHILPMASPAPAAWRKFDIPVWAPALLAASLLIVASAGVTYVLTTRANASSAARIAVVATADRTAPTNEVADAVPGAMVTPAPTGLAAVTDATVHTSPAHASTAARDNRTPAAAAMPQQRTAARLASRHAADQTDDVRRTYDAEINTLHDALEARRGQLNPATVAVIEQNLRVIDNAIQQSRTALARDPANTLLNDQLDRTLAKKTGLLRAAALLPAA